MWHHLSNPPPLESWQKDRILRDWAHARNRGEQTPASDDVIKILHESMRDYRCAAVSVSPPGRIVTEADLITHVVFKLRNHGLVDCEPAAIELVRAVKQRFGLPS